jgi:DNA-directed RNA polymerase specialized sigma24 family protein
VADWEQAMSALTHERGGALKRYAFLLCGNDAEADDLVQEALLRAFARPGRVRLQDRTEQSPVSQGQNPSRWCRRSE